MTKDPHRDIFDTIAQADVAATLFVTLSIDSPHRDSANLQLSAHIERSGAYRRVLSDVKAPASHRRLAGVVKNFIDTKTVRGIYVAIVDAINDLGPGMWNDLTMDGCQTEAAKAAIFCVHWGAFGADPRNDSDRKAQPATIYADHAAALHPIST